MFRDASSPLIYPLSLASHPRDNKAWNGEECYFPYKVVFINTWQWYVSHAEQTRQKVCHSQHTCNGMECSIVRRNFFLRLATSRREQGARKSLKTTGIKWSSVWHKGNMNLQPLNFRWAMPKAASTSGNSLVGEVATARRKNKKCARMNYFGTVRRECASFLWVMIKIIFAAEVKRKR